MLGRQPDGGDEFVEIDGLRQVIDGAVAHGRDRAANVREARHEQHRQGGVFLPHAPQGLDAGHSRHAHVADHHGERSRLQHLQCGFTRRGRLRAVALGAQECFQQAALPRIVVDNENGRRQ